MISAVELEDEVIMDGFIPKATAHVLAATVADDEITTAKLRKLAEAGASGMPVRDKQGGPGKVFGWLAQLIETGP